VKLDPFNVASLYLLKTKQLCFISSDRGVSLRYLA